MVTAHHASAASAGPYLNTQSFENVSRLMHLLFLYELILIMNDSFITSCASMLADLKNSGTDPDADSVGNFRADLYITRFRSLPEDPKKLSIFQRSFGGDHQLIRILAYSWLSQGCNKRTFWARFIDLYLSIADASRCRWRSSLAAWVPDHGKRWHDLEIAARGWLLQETGRIQL